MPTTDVGIQTAPDLGTDAQAGAVAAKAPAVVALALGAMLLFSVGFVHATVVHNGAHDTRHANGFPCH